MGAANFRTLFLSSCGGLSLIHVASIVGIHPSPARLVWRVRAKDMPVTVYRVESKMVGAKYET